MTIMRTRAFALPLLQRCVAQERDALIDLSLWLKTFCLTQNDEVAVCYRTVVAELFADPSAEYTTRALVDMLDMVLRRSDYGITLTGTRFADLLAAFAGRLDAEERGITVASQVQAHAESESEEVKRLLRVQRTLVSLAMQISRAVPADNAWKARLIDYLKREGIMPSPLRGDAPEPVQPVNVLGKMLHDAGWREPQDPPRESLLTWSDPQPPGEACRYDHVTADSPLGKFSIEWKGWKEFDGRTLYLGGEYLDTADTLDGAKALAEDRLRLAAAQLGPWMSVAGSTRGVLEDVAGVKRPPRHFDNLGAS